MRLQWIEYPVSIGDQDEEMTITWEDGSSDVAPANNGDGETIFQLPHLLEEIFRVENFNCFSGQSGQFIDEYPALFRLKTGAHVLRVKSEESFMNAFICQSKNPAECLISWIQGDLHRALHSPNNALEGLDDFHWVRVREVLGFIASGLLDNFPPLIFDPNDDYLESAELLGTEGFEKVELPWWYPPSREGPVFGYPAFLFLPETYTTEPNLENVESPSVAISVSQQLSESDWQDLLRHAFEGSLAQRVSMRTNSIDEHFKQIKSLAIQLGPIWLERWRNHG